MEELEFCVKHPNTGRCLHVSGVEQAVTVAQELADKTGNVVFYDIVDTHFASGGTPVYPAGGHDVPINVALSAGDWMHIMQWYSRLVQTGAVCHNDGDVFTKLTGQFNLHGGVQ